jgi:CheY-like chemotaxis protein
MPRMDGLQVLAKMKQDPRTRAIPVVMMTSSREEGDLLASYELGVNSFVVKPVDFHAFAETVSQVGMYWMLANEAPV